MKSQQIVFFVKKNICIHSALPIHVSHSSRNVPLTYYYYYYYIFFICTHLEIIIICYALCIKEMQYAVSKPTVKTIFKIPLLHFMK